jgi:hypothetical protein
MGDSTQDSLYESLDRFLGFEPNRFFAKYPLIKFVKGALLREAEYSAALRKFDDEYEAVTDAQFVAFVSRSTACKIYAEDGDDHGGMYEGKRYLIKVIPQPSNKKWQWTRCSDTKAGETLDELVATRRFNTDFSQTVVLPSQNLDDQKRRLDLIWQGVTLHYYNWHGMFAGIPAELLVQLPASVMESNKHLYYTCSVARGYDGDGYHRAVTQVFEMRSS